MLYSESERNNELNSIVYPHFIVVVNFYHLKIFAA